MFSKLFTWVHLLDKMSFVLFYHAYDIKNVNGSICAFLYIVDNTRQMIGNNKLNKGNAEGDWEQDLKLCHPSVGD